MGLMNKKIGFLTVFLALIAVISFASAATCGNGTVETGEACEGTNTGSFTCSAFGFSGGTISCSSCLLDVSACTGSTTFSASDPQNDFISTTSVNEASKTSLDITSLTANVSGDTLDIEITVKGENNQIVLPSGENTYKFKLSYPTSLSGSYSNEVVLHSDGTLTCQNSQTCSNQQISGNKIFFRVKPSNASYNFKIGAGSLAPRIFVYAYYNTVNVDAATITPSVPVTSSCGNGVIDSGEQCDGSNVNNQTCQSKGFDSGSLACNTTTCTFDTSNCTKETLTCGNGVIDAGEQCDGTNYNNSTCVSMGFNTGGLSCNADCTINTSSCTKYVCGNGVKEPGENCDGQNIGGKTCQTVGLGFSWGDLACGSDCRYDTSQCVSTNSSTCGNGTIDSGEYCDATNLNGYNCSSYGFSGGTISCSGTCSLNVSNCTGSTSFSGTDYVDDVYTIANAFGIPQNSTSAVDITALKITYSNNKTIVEYTVKGDNGKINLPPSNYKYIFGEVGVYPDGSVKCEQSYQSNISNKNYLCSNPVINGTNVSYTLNNYRPIGNSVNGVTYYDTIDEVTGPGPATDGVSILAVPAKSTCGNGVIETGEACDGTNLKNKSCFNWGYSGGSLNCDSVTCQYDLSACTTTSGSKCGDGKIDFGEECDAVNNGGQTCESLGLGSGSLKCGAQCSFDTRDCTSPNQPSPLLEPVLCGNGVIDSGEDCDGLNLNSQSCSSKGFDSGNLLCNSNCSFDSQNCANNTPAPLCGNGVVDAGEQCDGSNVNNQSCATNGFESGNLLCNSNCSFNTSACVQAPQNICGNNEVEAGEICDGTNLNNFSCSTYGFSGGTLSCSNCMLDIYACTGSASFSANDPENDLTGDNLYAWNIDPASRSSLDITGFSVTYSDHFTLVEFTVKGENGQVLTPPADFNPNWENTFLYKISYPTSDTRYTVNGVSIYSDGSIKCESIWCSEPKIEGTKISFKLDNSNSLNRLKTGTKNIKAVTYFARKGYADNGPALDQMILSTSPVQSVCGNGVIEAGEICDTTVPSNYGCSRWGYNAGQLSCDPVTCSIDYSGCFTAPLQGNVCGNLVCESGETTASCPSDCVAPGNPLSQLIESISRFFAGLFGG